MKLLITTQIMDKDDQMLGFFHTWVEEFSRHCDEVHIICLKEGKHNLPSNVYVYSLGKEGGVSRLKYLWRFFKYIWKLRKDYDSVFVHQNQMYVILGWLLWRLQRKQIGLWYMHRAVTLSLRIAEKLTNHLFTASKESFRLESKKLHITGHGIDAARFTPMNAEKSIDLLTVGRMVPSKNLEEIIEVLGILSNLGHKLSLTIVGSSVTPEDMLYEEELKSLISAKKLNGQVHFKGAVKHSDLPELMAKSRVFVHAATNGSLDKTLLEPFLMNVPVITSAEGAASLPLGNWHVRGVETFADQILETLQSNNCEKIKELRTFVKEHHTVQALIPKILKSLQAS